MNASILHLYTDEQGIDSWWSAQVVDIDIESKDPANPDFFVLYDEDESEPEYFLAPLIQDYYNAGVALPGVHHRRWPFSLFCA